MLIIDHLDKHYKGTDKGVTDISIHVEPGDIYAFIGHNGAGKTTLLKAITGIHGFDRGSVTIDGINLQEDPQEVKRRIAYIPLRIGKKGSLNMQSVLRSRGRWET